MRWVTCRLFEFKSLVESRAKRTKCVWISRRLLGTTIVQFCFSWRANVVSVDLVHDFSPGCAGVDMKRMQSKNVDIHEYGCVCNWSPLSCSGVDMKRMESKNVEGLFFAGELLDVDGITGGCVSSTLSSLSFESPKRFLSYFRSVRFFWSRDPTKPETIMDLKPSISDPHTLSGASDLSKPKNTVDLTSSMLDMNNLSRHELWATSELTSWNIYISQRLIVLPPMVQVH